MKGKTGKIGQRPLRKTGFSGPMYKIQVIFFYVKKNRMEKSDPDLEIPVRLKADHNSIVIYNYLYLLIIITSYTTNIHIC